MAYGYRNVLKRMQEERGMKELPVYVVEDEKGNKVNQDRVKMDKVMAPYTQRFQSRAADRVVSTSKKKKEEEEKRTWFQGGAFSDGYQFGDVTKTILGTGLDLHHDAQKGILGIAEKTIDAGAYAYGSFLEATDPIRAFGTDLFGLDEMSKEIREKDQRDDMQKFIEKDLIDEEGLSARSINQNPIGFLHNLISGNMDVYSSYKDIIKTGDDSSLKEAAFEEDSLLGKKTDSILQSAGQLGGTIALQMVGVPWFVTTGTTSFGGATEEAYKEDATHGEAGVSAAIKTAAEIAFEKLSGGISFGGKTADTWVKGLADNISSHTAKTLTKFGIDAVGEGAEEVLTEIAGNVAEKLTYEDEKTWKEALASPEALDQYLEAFIGGAALGGGVNAGRAVNSIQNNIDYDTGEIAPVDNTAQIEGLQNAITEKQTELQNSQDAREQQIIQEEIEQLSLELNEETNAQQFTNTTVDEKELRKQNFVYQAQETDSDIKKAVYESASQVMNNTEKSHKFVDVIAKIAEEKGTTYKFTNNEQLKQMGYAKDNLTVNGLVNENGEVLINIDSAKALNAVVGHETTHLLEGTQEYEALKQVAIEFAKSKGDYDTKMAQLHSLYKDTDANLENELVSDIVGDYLFTDEAFVRELSVKQPTLFEKIKNFISDLVVKFKGTAQEKQLRQLQRSFEKAYKTQGTQTSTETKYSVSTTDNQGRTLTKEQQEYFKDSKVRDENGNLLTVYHGTDGDFNVFEKKGGKRNIGGLVQYDADTKVFFFTTSKDYASNYGKNTKEGYLNITNPLFSSNKTYSDSDMDNIRYILQPLVDEEVKKGYIEIVNYSDGSIRYHDDSFYRSPENMWQRYASLETGIDWEHIDSESFNEVIDRMKEKGYDGTFVDELQQDEDGNDISSIVILNSNQFKNVDNTNPTSNPDIRYSLSEDNKGNPLSKEQQERYKYSKIRDENGNLKVMYHGTKRADRVGTLFDPNRATSGPMAFFTDSQDIAKSYSENKSDTSLSREYDTEYDLFKADGKDLDTYWNSLSKTEQQKINKEGNNVGFDDDWENIVYGENASENSFSDMYKWYLNNETQGNGIKALYHVWVQDGNIMEDDLYKFQEVLEKAGLKNVEFLDPYKVDSKVYEVYLNITNPFDTSNMPEDIINQFREASKTATIGEQYSADLWDKSNIAPEDWISKLESDIAEGTTHAWTVIPDWVTNVLKANGYDGIVDTGGKGGGVSHQVVIPFYSEQIKDISNANPTDNPNIDMSLSAQNEEIAPTGNWNVRGEDIKLQVEEAIKPLQETVEKLTEQVQTMQENIAPVQEEVQQPTQPTLEEVQNLIDIRDNKSGSEYASAFFTLRDKYGQVELYKALNEYYSTGTVTQPNNVENIDLAPVSQEVVEQQRQNSMDSLMNETPPVQSGLTELEQQEKALFDEFIAERGFDALDEQSKERYRYFQEQDIEEIDTDETEVISPLEDRNIEEVGDRKVKAYQYENPEVRPYFQTEAENMIWDLDNTIKGERTYNDQLYYDSNGEKGWFGTTRQTTEAIAYLKDNYGYSYAQIRQGLNDIIEDNGKENNAVAKRIEFMLDERLRKGYTTSDGVPIPPNDEYINFLKQRNITQYSEEAYAEWQKSLDGLEAPAEIDTEIAPIEQQTENIPTTEKIEASELPVSPQTEQVEQLIPIEGETAQNQNTDVTEAKARKWAKTSTESDILRDEIAFSDLDIEKVMYQPITNKGTLNKANDKLGTLGYKRAVEYFNSQIVNKKVSVEDIALGERLIQESIKQGDKATAAELIQNVAILGTELGQKVQALSIIQRMTPAGQLKMLDKTINRGKVKEDAAFKGVELTQEMKDKILSVYNEDGTYDQAELDRVIEEVKQEIADNMPVTAMEKINEWRYFSMLGNPKTHIRNLISNVAMKGTTSVKNAVARTIETIAPIENRTKTWKSSSQEVEDFAKQTTIEMKDIISDGGKYSETADIKSRRDTFKNKILNKLTNLNSDLLEKEDWWFSKGAFESSFSEFLTANGINTQEDIQNNPEIIEKGKLYAIEQAQIATFRQYSWLSNKIRDIENKNAATQIAVGSILPFKKTPINIAKTGLSYSPIGALKSLTYDLYQVKKGKMEASTAIDHIAQGATGTALTLIGYMLAQAGILNGAGDDDKEGKYDYQLGKQAYSLNIGGNTYSLSWLSPVAMPLFVGANAYNQLVEGEEWNADVVIETLGQTLDPLSEMSFLSSLTDALSSYESGGVQKLWGTLETMGQSYATQFIPTASSQLAATLDDTKRSTKVSGDSNAKFFEETYNKMIYKIPGLRQTLEPTTDIWGNEVKQSENLLKRAFENFISPYARKESIATEIDGELKDLYSETGEKGILPNIPYNYVNFEGEKYKMSAEEYTDFKKTYGQTANDLLEDLFRTTTYKTASSEDKVDMVNDVYDYASDLAKKEYLSGEGVDYTNATKDKKKYYKENDIKGAIDNDMSVEEYRLYTDDPEEYDFLKGKDTSYRRKYFDMQKSLSDIDKDYDDRKDSIPEGDMTKDEYDEAVDALLSEKKKAVVEQIINSGLDDSEKATLYKKAYNSDKVDIIVQSGINIDDFLNYSATEFKADKKSNGKTISGSRKNKVIDYVNSLELNIPQKAIIIKSTNTFKFNDYNEDIIDYVNGLDLSYQEKVDILDEVDIKVDSEGNIYWE